MSNHVPSLDSIIDCITIRMEATTDQDEYDALGEALEVIENYALRGQRTVGLIERILTRLTSTRKDTAA